MKRDRAFRIEQKERVIKNRKNLIKETGLEHSKQHQNNRYNKKHPYDCGNADCLLCHGEKVLGFKKRDDEVMDAIEKDQMEDITSTD